MIFDIYIYIYTYNQVYIVYISVQLNFIAAVGPYVPVTSLAVVMDKNHCSYLLGRKEAPERMIFISFELETLEPCGNKIKKCGGSGAG